MSCSKNNDAQYWYMLVIAAVVIILAVILVMLLTKEGYTAPKELCKSAEYPTLAENLSCHPNVVEVNLTASDNEVQILSGDATKLYNYNKSFPGPLIEAKKGDTLIVHFFNDISEPSSITWHGLLTPANMDGSQISAHPIEPGQSFTYQFELLNSGLFWYHSDINSREQVQKGLYGIILVKDYAEDTCHSLPSNEKVLAFSDLNLDATNQVDIEFSSVPCERASQQVNGILGNVLLTNGVYNGCISLSKNVPVRLYMVNCATDRFMKITLEGHDMLRIGGDQGLLEKPILITEENGLILTTGERAEIVFVPRHDQVRLFTTANPKGIQKVVTDECGNCELVDQVTKDETKILLVTFNVYDNGEAENLEVPLELKKIHPIKVDHCTPVIPVYYGNWEPDCDGNIDFYAFRNCRKGIPFDRLSAKEAPIVFEDGTYVIEVTNTSPLANNFHLHGFMFQHLETLYMSESNRERIVNQVLENKDTIYIPAKPEGRKSKTVVRLAVRFSSEGRDILAYGKEPTEKRSGGWIMQSHVLTHANLGQEAFIQVVAECDREKYSSSSGYINSYSTYSDSKDYSSCLTRDSGSSFKSSNSKSDWTGSSSSSRSGSRSCSRSGSRSCSRSGSRSSSYETDLTELSYSLEELTQSLITCSCGSGINSSMCCSSKQSSDHSNSSSLEWLD